MFLRRRRQPGEPDAYALNTLSNDRSTATQWQNTIPPVTRTNGMTSSIAGQHTASLAISPPVLAHPKPKPPITWALLNKPLPPLPPEAFADMPPEKPPIKPMPNLAQHPALRAPVPTSSHRVGYKGSRPAEHVKEPSGLVMDSSRRSSTSSEFPRSSKRRGIRVIRKTKGRSMSLADTIEQHERPEMTDRGTQTTPSLEAKQTAPFAVPSPNPAETTPATIRPSPGKARIWRKSSSEEVTGKRSPLWSPRTILKHSVDYFANGFDEEDADTEDNIESQFKKYLGRLKPATPPTASGRARAATTAFRTSSNDNESAFKLKEPPRPGILRNSKLEDKSTSMGTKVVTYGEVKPRPHADRINSTNSIMTISGKSPGEPATRPLPLPLQKLTSFSHGPIIRRRISHHSESGSSAGASPLRQELQSHSQISITSPASTVHGAAQTAVPVADPVSFKINRPRAIKLPPRGQPSIQPSGPPTPQEVEEAADLFFARAPYLVDEPDEYSVRLRAEPNVPEHLAGSPLCPMHPKHKSGGWGICPYHGRRKSATDSTTEDRRVSGSSTSKSLPSSCHESPRRPSAVLSLGYQSPRRSSIVRSDPEEDQRRASVESQHEHDHHRRSALDISEEDHKRFSDESEYGVRPKLGRQTSWGAAMDDGAVRGFGFSPSPASAKPATPATVSAPELSRNRSVIYNTVVKHLQINDDERDGLSHDGYKHEEQRLKSAQHSPYPSPHISEDVPVTPVQQESRATRNASSRKGRQVPVTPAVMERGDRVGMVMASDESIYRLARNY